MKTNFELELEKIEKGLDEIYENGGYFKTFKRSKPLCLNHQTKESYTASEYDLALFDGETTYKVFILQEVHTSPKSYTGYMRGYNVRNIAFGDKVTITKKGKNSELILSSGRGDNEVCRITYNENFDSYLGDTEHYQISICHLEHYKTVR